jgi:hypothetical protein
LIFISKKSAKKYLDICLPIDGKSLPLRTDYVQINEEATPARTSLAGLSPW